MSMKNFANTVKMPIPKSNWHDKSHDMKLTLNMGNLVPVSRIECVPGDVVKLKHQMLLRFMPLVNPVMHRYDATIHTWFVPYRILWDNFEKFITDQPVGGSVPAFPTIQVGSTGGGELVGWSKSGLSDYLGIPNPQQGAAGQIRNINAMAHAAYQCIYSNWYRNQNFEDEINYKLVDGDNSSNAELYILRRRKWEADYFTACLPEAQKGPQVMIPLGTFSDVAVKAVPTPGQPGDDFLILDGTGNPSGAVRGTDVAIEPGSTPIGGSEIFADTSSLQAAGSISDLREATALQRFYERLMRIGTRLKEYFLGVWGVENKDSRLQLPEYVCGVKQGVVISEVLNTTGEAGGLPQGNMAGHGITVLDGSKETFFCPEHGVIISMLSVMPKTAYANGIDKFFFKTTQFSDYFTPDLAHLSEQPVINEEVFAFAADGGTDTFGFLPVYSDYRTIHSRIAGDFRDTLDDWHSARLFTTPPVLNNSFVTCETDDRIFAVTEEESDKLVAHVYHDLQVLSKVPKYGTPAL